MGRCEVADGRLVTVPVRSQCCSAQCRSIVSWAWWLQRSRSRTLTVGPCGEIGARNSCLGEAL